MIVQSPIFKRLSTNWNATQRKTCLLIALWAVSMICLPIAFWVFGEGILPLGVTLAAVLQASTVFYIVAQQWGIIRTLQTLLIVGFIAWLAEFIGHTTGLPFGNYQYTRVLQPQINGVPLLIPLAWFMLLPSAWAIAEVITGNRKNTKKQKLAYIAVSAAALTAWDFFLDPQMVQWNFWQWQQPGAYFGIPLVNYMGWFLVAALITLVIRPAPLPKRPLMLIYAIVWFLQSIGQAAFWGQPGPAVVGFLTMGSMMLLAFLSFRRRST